MTTKLNTSNFIFQDNIREIKIIGGFLCGKDSEETVLGSVMQSLSPGCQIIRAYQVHGTDILTLSSKEETKEFLSQDYHNHHYDGLLTDQIGHLLIIRTADCVPILFYSRSMAKVWIGGIHCGWRPLAKGIIPRLFQLNPFFRGEDIRFLIGPAIEQKCYEVGEEVINAFKKSLPDLSFVVKKHGPKNFLLDLQGLSRLLLIQEGVSDSAIDTIPICTKCHPAFFSHRENKTHKRNTNFISLNVVK